MEAALEGFLSVAIDELREEPGVVGVALGGSFTTGDMDPHSDLDFVIASDESAWPAILDRRPEIASRLGPLLQCFTGEHVGEPRLLICLYGPPLLHIDLKFVSIADAHERVEDPAIVWEADGALSRAFERSEAVYPIATAEWLEDRFWIWVQNTGTKLERGELFEVLNMLAYIRAHVLGPLALARAGSRPDGVRRLEVRAPELATRLGDTVPGLDPGRCVRALRACAELYRELRDTTATGTASDVEREVLAYLTELEARLT